MWPNTALTGQNEQKSLDKSNKGTDQTSLPTQHLPIHKSVPLEARNML